MSGYDIIYFIKKVGAMLEEIFEGQLLINYVIIKICQLITL